MYCVIFSVYFETTKDVNEAIAREKQLKKWSRSKKDWLIDMINKERVDLMDKEGDSSTTLGMTFSARNDKERI